MINHVSLIQCTQIFVGDIDLETKQIQELHGISFLCCSLVLPAQTCVERATEMCHVTKNQNIRNGFF